MLNGIRIYSSDHIWAKIVGDLGATLAAESKFADIDMDSLNITEPISVIELKSIILKKINAEQQVIINKVFGRNAMLPLLQMQIIVLLFKTGGMSAVDIKNALGFSPDMATHTIDTAIYNLRKTYGRDFIKLENGKYFIDGI